ncbi:hypothetical protein HG531_013260 [Fusarium graminearum]|nr:hypothetical protein HG531_013260 [Fusarium graminearum]
MLVTMTATTETWINIPSSVQFEPSADSSPQPLSSSSQHRYLLVEAVMTSAVGLVLFTPQAVVGLIRGLRIASCADQLRLLGLDTQHVAGVVLNQASILVLEFLNLRHELAAFLSHLFNLANQSIVGCPKLLDLGSFHSSKTAGWRGGSGLGGRGSLGLGLLLGFHFGDLEKLLDLVLANIVQCLQVGSHSALANNLHDRTKNLGTAVSKSSGGLGQKLLTSFTDANQELHGTLLDLGVLVAEVGDDILHALRQAGRGENGVQGGSKSIGYRSLLLLEAIHDGLHNCGAVFTKALAEALREKLDTEGGLNNDSNVGVFHALGQAAGDLVEVGFLDTRDVECRVQSVNRFFSVLPLRGSELVAKVGGNLLADILRLSQIKGINFFGIFSLYFSFLAFFTTLGGSGKSFLLRSEQTFLLGRALGLDLFELCFQISLLGRLKLAPEHGLHSLPQPSVKLDRQVCSLSTDVLVGSTKGFGECFEHRFRVDNLAAIVVEDLCEGVECRGNVLGDLVVQAREHVLDDRSSDVEFNIEQNGFNGVLLDDGSGRRETFLHHWGNGLIPRP